MFTDYSISKKLTWMNMLVSGAALLTACVALVGCDLMTFRAVAVSNLSTQAQIAASNSISALLFDDPRAAQNTLSGLKTAPNIKSAGIYTSDGHPFAAYWRDQGGQVPALPPVPPGKTEAYQFEGNQVVLVRTIVSQGKPVGTVYMPFDSQMLSARLRRYAGITAIVLAASLLAALLVSSLFRHAVTEPIVHLSGIARAVSRDKNYSVRAAPSGSGGELKVLVDAFNEMLMQIQERDGALQKGRDELEQRVQERTAELEAAKKELERASKFKDEFLSIMSHELRTPLNAVLGFSDMLADERYGTLNDRQRRYVSHIHTGGTHLLKLVSDILDLSKIEAGKMEIVPEDVNIASAFGEVLSALQPLADKKSQCLTQEVEPRLCVHADSTRFKQILMNLLGNAIKFTPEVGRIELVARQVEEQVRMEVRDNGPGIAAEDQQRIFEAFIRLAQTGDATEGTGLGLAITARLVELHGSKLEIESKPGAGTCFHFSLRHAVIALDEPARTTIATPRAGKTPRILIVEDNAVMGQLIQSLLKSAGYETLRCDQPERAAEMAVEHQPDCVTLDLFMQPIDGQEILLQLKNDPRTSNIAVIVITMADQPGVGTTFGTDEYLVKPVNRATLLAAVERCLTSRGAAAPARAILLVEDDASTREMIEELLTGSGYSVVAAADGAQARARMSHALPELIILDLVLPKVSGLELLAEWRSNPRTADVPVFVLTSKALSKQEEQFLRKHAEALFHKEQSWQQALMEQLQRVLKNAPAVKV
jgi:signal transduction histidine kinase/DNA-binding response OmpR family regulator